MKLVRHWIGLLLVALLGTLPGCPKRTHTPRPRASLEPGRITGHWVGVARGRAAPGIHRLLRVLYRLKAHSSGKITGSVELQGTLRATARKKLLCIGKPTATIHRTAEIAHGKLGKKLLYWKLAPPRAGGSKPCAYRFPSALECTARPAVGRLALRCGALALSLRPARVTGVWVWNERRTDRAGDSITKRQRFHLVQRGDTVTGFADDIRVHVSRDGQRYRCNGRLRYTRQARHRLEGRLSGRNLSLRVISTLSQKGPCQGTLTLPSPLTGQWKPFEGRVELSFTEGGRMLRRLPNLRPVGIGEPPTTGDNSP